MEIILGIFSSFPILNKLNMNSFIIVVVLISLAFFMATFINSYISFKFFKLTGNVEIPKIKNSLNEKQVDYTKITYLFEDVSAKEAMKTQNNISTSTLVEGVEGLSFIGSVISKNRKLAFLKKGNQVFFLEEGDRVNGFKIKEINKIFVKLQKGNQLYVLYPKGGNSSIYPKQKNATTQNLEKKIIKVSKLEVQKETEDIGKLLKNVRIVPVVKNGETIGFRFTYISPKSPLYKYGLRSGDLIKSINGMPVRTAEEAFKIYNMLRNEEHITLEIERRGKRKVIFYEIQ